MARAKISGPQKTVEVARGLFALSYADADDRRSPPLVRVASRGSDVTVITHPDGQDGVLRRPGSVLIVRAVRPGALVIEVTPGEPDGSVAVSLKLEPLGGVSDMTAPVLLDRFQPEAPGPLQVLGHVAGVGDVIAQAGSWIGGPASPSRIEGIAIDWPDKPPGLVVRYAAKFGGARGGSSAVTEVGGFAGTRQRAIPLVGFEIELDGPEARQHVIMAEAVFLGAPVVRASGRRLSLIGATGREPLVGLKLLVEQTQAARAPAPVRASAAVVPPSKAVATRPAEPAMQPAFVQGSGRVRVFRSAARSDLVAS